MDVYTNAARQIIKEQQAIIGTIAYDQARKVTGLDVKSDGNVTITGNAKEVLGNLVNVYSQFFGNASVEVCRDAVRQVKPELSSDELPDILK